MGAAAEGIAWYACSMSELTIARQAIAHRGKRLEYFTIVWNFLEGLVAIAAGAVSGSISLVGFGINPADFLEGRFWIGSGWRTIREFWRFDRPWN